MRRLAWLLVLALLPAIAEGEPWLGVNPGTSDKAAVRALFGAPTREVAKKEEGFDTSEWLYEGASAPPGATRLLVQFGLSRGQGFQADVVRALTYYPKPNIFPRPAIIGGWGLPDRTGTERGTGSPIFFYRRGLYVRLDKDGQDALEMVFTIEQPE